MKNRKYFVIILIILALTLIPSKVYAIEEEFVTPTIPSFPKCVKPQGDVKVSYDEGIHGIVGDNGTYSGSDTVYQLSEDTLVQCFCAPNDSGVQTNWWKVSSLDAEQIEYLKKLGWVYVPNGADWGLAEAPYMAFNFTLSCHEDKTVHNANDGHNDDDDNDGGRGGVVLGIGGPLGDVLGLASTGNLGEIILMLTAGFSSLLIAVGILKLQSNEQ